MTVREPVLDDTLGLVGEVLGIREVPGRANFFEIGGDSLSAAHLCLLLEERLDSVVPVLAVYDVDTLAQLHEEVLRCHGR